MPSPIGSDQLANRSKPRGFAKEISRADWEAFAILFEIFEWFVVQSVDHLRARFRWAVIEGPRAIARWEDDGGAVAKGK